jgi:uncharacterized protein YecT (DUF1311 family)
MFVVQRAVSRGINPGHHFAELKVLVFKCLMQRDTDVCSKWKVKREKPMRILAALLAGFAMNCLANFSSAGRAEELTCPFKSNDDCDRWEFEQADKRLTSALASAFAKIEAFAHPDTRKEAKDSLEQAHSLWKQLREKDCQAESALMWLRSARTRKGYTAACLNDSVIKRIAEIKKRYHLD